MAELKVPTDYDRLPEFRALVAATGESFAGMLGISEAIATHMFFRLWADLSYQAQGGIKLGGLTTAAAELYAKSLHLPVESESHILPALLKSGVLTRGEDFYHCDRFARMNEHLSSDYVSREVKGANRSAFKRAQPRIEAEASNQLVMLAGGALKDRAGERLTAEEERRVVVMIRKLDSALQPERKRRSHEYGEGVIADAVDVVRRFKDEEWLYRFYCWLLDNRGKAGVPGNAEAVLSAWDETVRKM